MRLSEHRRRPSHSSFRQAGGNQLCLQQINSITPPVDLVFFKTGGWTVTEWLPRIFNHLFTRWSLVRTKCVWSLFVQCYRNLQWDLNPRIHSLVQGAALAACVWGLFHITILQNFVLVLAGGFGPPKAQGAGDLQSPGIDHYPKLAYKMFSILTHTMEKSASQYNLFLVIIPFVEYNIIQFSLYSFTTLPI